MQYDPNPQTPGPWVAPQPQEMNNDMMWHDPNPKQKKVQRDTGTAIWGDPSQQPVVSFVGSGISRLKFLHRHTLLTYLHAC